MATVPPAVAAPAQDIINPSSPMAATPQPNLAAEVVPKVEVKMESQLDCQAEDGGYGLSSCAASSFLASCMFNATAGNAPPGLNFQLSRLKNMVLQNHQIFSK